MRNKILMTLVLLLTAATGAWAWTSGGCTVNYDNNGNMTVSKNGNGQMADIDYLYNRAWTSVASSVTNLVIEEGVTKIGSATFMNFTSITEITIPNSVTTIGDDAFTACISVTKVTIGSGVTNIAQDAFYNIPYVTDVYCYADPANLTWNENNNDFGQDVETKCHVPAEYLDAYKAKFNGHVHVTFVALAVEVTPVAEPAANTLQWTFEMPASDVLLTPRYAPTATWTVVEEVSQVPTAAEGVVAGTNAKIVTPGKTTQGTVMYAVTTTATAPALTAFSATVPTADFLEGTYETEQTVYVWYYIKGADTPANTEATEENTFNDSEICAEPLTVVLQPNVFDITFNPANANTIESGKATVTVGGTAATVTDGKLENVKMGSEVKIKAKEGYKFRKVEVKKGATTSTQLSAATTDDIGKVVCAAGHLHDAKTAVPDGCTAVGILGKVTETGHGLILALKDATSQNWNTINGWTSASYAGTTLKVLPDDDARGTNLTSYTALGGTAVSDWAVAQYSDYEAIFTNLGSTMGDNHGKTYDDHVEAYITTGVGGAAISGAHWSATEDSDTNAFVFYPYYYWYPDEKTNGSKVRPVLGF